MNFKHKINNICFRLSPNYPLLSKFIAWLLNRWSQILFYVYISERKTHLERLKKLKSLSDYFDFTKELLPSHQIKSEITDFLQFAAQLNPIVVCEIGVAEGGTNFLLGQSIKSIRHVVAIDQQMNNSFKIKYFSRPDIKHSFISGCSYEKNTINTVKKCLKGKKIDLLFIDGDHRYNGVKNDFEIYKQLVSTNGLIAFHDINEDHETRYGNKTNNWAGDVPKFWNEIKDFYETKEFIEDKNQDGRGIGLLLLLRLRIAILIIILLNEY